LQCRASEKNEVTPDLALWEAWWDRDFEAFQTALNNPCSSNYCKDVNAEYADKKELHQPILGSLSRSADQGT